MKFCNNCGNMYYMKIDDNNCNSLIHYCRHCGNVDDTLTNEGLCVLENQLKKTEQKFDHIINPYTKLDPTLPRIAMKCPNESCKTNQTSGGDANAKPEHEVIFLRFDEENLKFVYICPDCDYTWISK